jgi:hypothetical protein
LVFRGGDNFDGYFLSARRLENGAKDLFFADRSGFSFFARRSRVAGF